MGRILRLIVCCSIIWVNAASALEFTAERLVMKNGHRDKATLYCRADMWRIEHNTLGPVDVTIVRKDQGVIWLLMAHTKRFMTLPFDPQMGPTCQHDFTSGGRRDLIGREILQGRSTTVSKVTVREGTEDVTYYEWLADDVKVPLRVARKDGTWLVDYGNLHVTRLPTYLFELPLSYVPVHVP